MSPRKLFEQELEELRQDVLQMAEWVQDGYDCLFAALEKKDGDQMRRYVRHDRTIEDMQRNIESQLSLIHIFPEEKDHHRGPCGDPGAGRRDPGRGLRLSGPPYGCLLYTSTFPPLAFAFPFLFFISHVH